MTVSYVIARKGQKVNHKGKWLNLTGYYSGGYWQAQDGNNSLTWIKNNTIKPTTINLQAMI